MKLENASEAHMYQNNQEQFILMEENVISLLQNKNGIEYSSDIEVLMYESNAPS